jgi:two-component system CheB/CheR fusion protein
LTARPTTDELLWLLLRQARDHALILLDASGTVVDWLAGSEHIFGWTRAEVMGETLHRLFTEDDQARGAPDHEMAVARADGRAEDDRWQVRKDGTRFWASGVLVPLRDASGAVVGFGKVLRDRTDVRAQVEALDNRADALADSNRRHELVLATLAHELRTPLGALANAVELMALAGAASEEIRYPLQIVQRQVDAIRRLVDDLMDVGRAGAGKLDLERTPVDLRGVLLRAAEASRPPAEQRGQDFRVLMLPGALPVLGDADRLRQVIVNLLDNAVKYTPEGGRVWLKATVEGQEAVVRVEDTGIGIAPEAQPGIFELFTQEEVARPMAAGGIGLGLSLVKQLVTLHGGTVQVRSEGRGKGSEFTVRLPLAPGVPGGAVAGTFRNSDGPGEGAGAGQEAG